MINDLSKKAKEAFVQYSKKMCTRVTIFWMVYRITNFLVVLMIPSITNALVDLCAGVDTIMIVNMGTYMLNSSTEKVAVAFSKRNSTIEASTKNEDAEDEEETEEGDEDTSNG